MQRIDTDIPLSNENDGNENGMNNGNERMSLHAMEQLVLGKNGTNLESKLVGMSIVCPSCRHLVSPHTFTLLHYETSTLSWLAINDKQLLHLENAFIKENTLELVQSGMDRWTLKHFEEPTCILAVRSFVKMRTLGLN